ncbi:hypothetical protein GJ688_01810 [Heliobacillus mobilis]|uniref:Transglutaminase-like domain-containing protein n=1 Tax=Heliobacterium mobile TaxID=28064 RepID=A0A6I3SBB2_HELMO|nr:transglutaminase-like domain-containing protein [Heliobacterium mobile]MTV47717.1 hypothetical protein [Heliobacterium mobile]
MPFSRTENRDRIIALIVIAFLVIVYWKSPKHTLYQEMAVSDTKEIDQLAASITNGLSTDLQKTKAIHDWVAKNITYDTENFFNGTINSREYTAHETLKKRTAVCAGYANLNAALHRAAGIPVKVVSGVALGYGLKGKAWSEVDTTKPNHAWNEVYVNGKWIIEDPTWDAGYVTPDKKFVFSLRDTYFGPDPKEFAKDHLKLTEVEY